MRAREKENISSPPQYFSPADAKAFKVVEVVKFSQLISKRINKQIHCIAAI